MPRLESDLEREVVKWCESRGYLCLKLAIIGLRGFPDRTIIDNDGRVTFVELKKPKGGRLSHQQKLMHTYLRSHSHNVVMARTLEEVIDAVHRSPDA